MRVFLRKFAALSWGGVLAQVAVALAAPVLSRIFTPEDYGISGLTLSVVMILVFVATLRYEEVIVAGRSERSRLNAFSLAVSLALLLSLALLAVVALGAVLPPGQHASYALYFFAPPILLLSVLQYRVLPALLVHFGFYRFVSSGNLVNGIGGVLAQIGFGLLGWGALGLLLGRSIGYLAAILTMLLPTWTRIAAPVRQATTRRRALQTLRLYRNQALFLAPAGFANTLAMQMPVFALAASFGTAASGAYFFTQGLANASLTVYRRSITALTAKEARQLIAAGKPILPFLLRLVGLVAVCAIAAAAVLFVTAERLIPFVFGADWVLAGVVAKWLGVFYAASAIHLPASGLATLLGFQRNMLTTQIAQVLATAGALMLGAWTGSLEATVALVGLATASVAGLHMLRIFSIVAADDRRRAAERART